MIISIDCVYVSKVISFLTGASDLKFGDGLGMTMARHFKSNLGISKSFVPNSRLKNI